MTDFKSSFQRILIFSQKWLSNMACRIALVCIASALKAEPHPLTLAFFDNPPYYRVTEQGTPEGFLLKKTITLFTEAEIPFQLRSIPPARILSTIMNDEGMICSPGWFKTDERAAVTRFSEPLYQDRPLSVLFLVKDQSLFTPYSTLRALLASPSLIMARVTSFSYGKVIDEWLKTSSIQQLAIDQDPSRIPHLLQLKRANFALIAPETLTTLLKDTGVNPALFATTYYPDSPPGNQRYIMCSRSVPDSVLDRINQQLSMRRGSTSEVDDSAH